MRQTNRAKRLMAKGLLLLVFLALALFTEERWRGEWALKKWNAEMRAKGEILDLSQLLPLNLPSGLEFSNRFALAAGQLPTSLAAYTSLNGIIPDRPGTARRGSQERNPTPASKTAPINSWRALTKTLGQSAQVT